MLVASDYYVVPIRLDYLSTLVLEELNRNITEIESDYNSDIESENEYMNLQLMGVVCNIVLRKVDDLIYEQENLVD